MAWGKVDDGLHDHPKVDAALEPDEREGLAALGLWVLVLSCVSGQLTDGVISQRVVRRLAPDHGQRLAGALVEYGLWDVVDDRWQIHDYLDYNDSREKILARRAARAAAGKRGGKASGKTRREASAGADGVAVGEALASPVGEADRCSSVEPRPDPTLVEREWGASAPANVDGERLTAVVAVLRTAPRLTFDPIGAGVANVLAAFPNVDHVQAAHIAVSNVADPNYRTTDAAKALRFAINDLERQQRPRAGNGRTSTAADRRSEHDRLQDERRETALRVLRDQSDETTEAA
jgi:hypothetical protein